MKPKTKSNKERDDILHKIFDDAKDEKEEFDSISDFIEKMNKRLIRELNDERI